MPYTLAKFFLWGLLMALAGGVIGWLLRSLKCRGEVLRARTVTIDEAELERLRGRVANLEPAVAERDRLRMELADVRGSSVGALGFASADETSIVPAGTATDKNSHADIDADSEPDTAIDPVGALRNNSGDGASSIAAFADTAPAGEAADDADTSADNETTAEDAPVEAPVELDLAEAATALGKKIKLDDLTVVEGIGPKIAELCSGIGVTTWQGLARTDVSDLQSMLDAAGSRFQMHKPASWPQQAELLATGKWAEFVALTDSLSGGK